MGSICATVKNVQKDTLEVEIQNDGIIYENSQVTFQIKHGTHEDYYHNEEEHISKDVRFCLENDVDYIIHSVYNGKQEISHLINMINEENEKIKKDGGVQNPIKVIAKLENEEAIKDLPGILEIADAILIPRGVLGTVLPIEKISWIQKGVIKLCNNYAKPCILAS